jgi:hypothetical protein
MIPVNRPLRNVPGSGGPERVRPDDPISNTVSLTCAPGCNTQNECNPLGLVCKPAPDGDAGTAVNICEQV